MTHFAFDANNFTPEERIPVPAGVYTVVLTEGKIEPTKSGSGLRLMYQLKIIGGDHNGRVIFESLNIKNDNPIAEEIASKRLSAYCHATKVLRFDNPAALHNIPIKVKVKIKTDPEYGDKNEVSDVLFKEGPQNVAVPASNPMSGQSGNSAPPWTEKEAVPMPSPNKPRFVRRMTEKAGAYTYEQFTANGWTDEMLVTQGYMEMAQEAPPAPAPAPAPPGPPAPVGPSGQVPSGKRPWEN